MIMKKYIPLFLFALAVALSCTRFDDSAIWEELLNHKERIEKLETECNRLNININSLQDILEALQANDYVTDIVKIMEGGVEVGYSITFAKGGTVTISTYEEPNDYCICVSDDGIGFDVSGLTDTKKHIGIRNVRERLQAMCDGSLTIESQPGTGTRVLIRIPKEGQGK